MVMIITVETRDAQVIEISTVNDGDGDDDDECTLHADDGKRRRDVKLRYALSLPTRPLAPAHPRRENG
jgi:hypothetical protein